MSRESLFAVRFWKRAVISLDRGSFLRWLDLKSQIIGDRCSDSREIQFVIAEALDMPAALAAAIASVAKMCLVFMIDPFVE